MLNSRLGRFVSAVVLATIMVGPVLAQNAEEACRRAESEQPLMWYSSQDPAFNANVVRAFTTAYPRIRAASFRLPSGALAARYASEREAGVINADIITVADPGFVNSGHSRNWFAPLAKSELAAVNRLDDKNFVNGVAMTGINVAGITFNSSIMKEPPKDWPDLLRPELKGRIALSDPRNVPTWMAVFSILRDELGPDFLKGLANQNMVIVPSAVPGTQQMAAGEFAVVFPNTLAVVAPVKDKGGPVEYAPMTLTTGVEYWTMLSAGARAPNAAKCLYNFLFTNEGQKAFNGTTSVAAFSDIEGTAPLPAGYRSPIISDLAAQEREILTLLGIR